MQKKMLFSFHFRVHVTSAEPMLQKIERKKKNISHKSYYNTKMWYLCTVKRHRIYLILTILSLLTASCTDGEGMRQQLADLQMRNQADSLLTDDSLALALCDYFDSHGTPNEGITGTGL